MEQTIGKRIMKHRKRLGLTQDQLAEKLGVTAQAVSKWENNQSCPDITMIPQLADIFGITTDQLLGRTEESVVYEAEVVEDPVHTYNGKHNVEVSYHRGRKSALAFALWVIAVGGLYLLATWRVWDLHFWTILWTTGLLAFGLYPKFSFFRLGCALLGGYSLASHIFPMPFNLTGSFVMAVVILLFGISLLFDAIKKDKKPSFRVTYTDRDGIKHTGKNLEDYEIDDDSFSFDCSFGSQHRQIDMDTLRCGDISTSFGNFIIDLSGVKSVTDDAELNVDCSFGKTTLLVPQKFLVKPDTSTNFAGFELQGTPDAVPQGTLVLSSSVNFGEVIVRYI